MLRLTANKTKLYTLVADYVDNLPPMRKTEFIKYPRTPDYALEWTTEREKGRAFLSACMGRPLLMTKKKPGGWYGARTST